MSLIRGVFNVVRDVEGGERLLFRCPGCRRVHGPSHGAGPGARWTFNGDYDKPVFSPSLLVQWDEWTPPVTAKNHKEFNSKPWPQTKVSHRCHSFIGCNGAAPGQIIFLGDCTHSLAGQIVDIPPFSWTDDSDE
jgi:hypothetical protein